MLTKAWAPADEGARGMRGPLPTQVALPWASGRTGCTYHVLLQLEPPLRPLLVFFHAAVQVGKLGGSFLKEKHTQRRVMEKDPGKK